METFIQKANDMSIMAICDFTDQTLVLSALEKIKSNTINKSRCEHIAYEMYDLADRHILLGNETIELRLKRRLNLFHITERVGGIGYYEGHPYIYIIYIYKNHLNLFDVAITINGYDVDYLLDRIPVDYHTLEEVYECLNNLLSEFANPSEDLCDFLEDYAREIPKEFNTLLDQALDSNRYYYNKSKYDFHFEW